MAVVPDDLDGLVVLHDLLELLPLRLHALLVAVQLERDDVHVALLPGQHQSLLLLPGLLAGVDPLVGLPGHVHAVARAAGPREEVEGVVVLAKPASSPSLPQPVSDSDLLAVVDDDVVLLEVDPLLQTGGLAAGLLESGRLSDLRPDHRSPGLAVHHGRLWAAVQTLSEVRTAGPLVGLGGLLSLGVGGGLGVVVTGKRTVSGKSGGLGAYLRLRSLQTRQGPLVTIILSGGIRKIVSIIVPWSSCSAIIDSAPDIIVDIIVGFGLPGGDLDHADVPLGSPPLDLLSLGLLLRLLLAVHQLSLLVELGVGLDGHVSRDSVDLGPGPDPHHLPVHCENLPLAPLHQVLVSSPVDVVPALEDGQVPPDLALDHLLEPDVGQRSVVLHPGRLQCVEVLQQLLVDDLLPEPGDVARHQTGHLRVPAEQDLVR